MASHDVPTRFYRPRPEWVWNSEQNPELTKRVDLEVTLRGAGAKNAVQHWLEVIGARQDEEHVFVRGGVAIGNIASYANCVTLLLSSGGQDALESLDDIALTMHESILLPQRCIAVHWVEKPIRD